MLVDDLDTLWLHDYVESGLLWYATLLGSGAGMGDIRVVNVAIGLGLGQILGRWLLLLIALRLNLILIRVIAQLKCGLIVIALPASSTQVCRFLHAGLCSPLRLGRPLVFHLRLSAWCGRSSCLSCSSSFRGFILAFALLRG